MTMRVRRSACWLLVLSAGLTLPAAGATAAAPPAGASAMAASYWDLDPEFRALSGRYLYRTVTQRVEPTDVVLRVDQAPAYFAALAQQGVLAVHDARVDPRTRGFSESYLAPLGISAVLDVPVPVPVLLRGSVVGILCHEHVGPPRGWTEREQAFARAIAEMISLSREAAERKAAEQALMRERELAQVTLHSIADAVVRLVRPPTTA